MPAVTPDHALERLLLAVRRQAVRPRPQDRPGRVGQARRIAIVLSPSSYGLAAVEVLRGERPGHPRETSAGVVGAEADRGRLAPRRLHRKGRRSAPADAERLDATLVGTVRGIPLAALDGYKKMMAGSLTRATPEHVREWMTRQVFIALGVFLTTAAMIGVDACPMEGFEHEKYDDILGLPAKGYHSVVVATAGYRADTDAYAKLPKVRYEKAELIETI